MMMIIIIIIIKYVIIRDNNGKRRCMLIDVAISGDRNVIKREAGKILKYKELVKEIQRMWNVRAKAIPVIIGAAGTISKVFRQYLSNIPGKGEIKGLQNNHIVHCTQTAECGNVKAQDIFKMRNNITCSTNCKCRTAAEMYTLETWFASGI